MTEQPPAPVREALIESVPILIGHMDGHGAVEEIEGGIPHAGALGSFEPGHANLLEMFPDDAAEIRSALAGGRARFEARSDDEDEAAYFELRIIFDRRRGSGAYFLVHDITETRQLQLALLDCTDHEQMRVGGELHDTLGQELTGIAYQLHALKDRLPPDLAAEAARLQEGVSNSLKHARDIAFSLSPQIAGEEIAKVFGRLCDHMRGTFGVDCVFEPEIGRPISDPGVAFHLFRIAREACLNAARHGSPAHITIRLRTGADNLLEIADDGSGFACGAPSDLPGMGIPMMKFRARAMGGSLRVERNEPRGIRVRCRFTLSPVDTANSSTETCPACS